MGWRVEASEVETTAMAEEGMIEVVVQSSSHIQASMAQQSDTQEIPSRRFPPHLELTLHMLPGMPSMAICLLRASSSNTKVS